MTHSTYLALLSALPFTVLLWSVSWCARYIPVPIKNWLVRLAVQLTLGIAVIAICIGQIVVYRSVAGLVAADNLLVGLVIAENVVGFIIILLDVRARQKRTQSPS